MPTPQTKPATKANVEHHTSAAECCDKAAKEHRHAAECCATGDHKNAKDHARRAQDYSEKAHEHGKHAMAA
jgi:hypothetical protein